MNCIQKRLQEKVLTDIFYGFIVMCAALVMKDMEYNYLPVID